MTIHWYVQPNVISDRSWLFSPPHSKHKQNHLYRQLYSHAWSKHYLCLATYFQVMPAMLILIFISALPPPQLLLLLTFPGGRGSCQFLCSASLYFLPNPSVNSHYCGLAATDNFLLMKQATGSHLNTENACNNYKLLKVLIFSHHALLWPPLIIYFLFFLLMFKWT